jgi:hypothetical protein
MAEALTRIGTSLLTNTTFFFDCANEKAVAKMRASLSIGANDFGSKLGSECDSSTQR